MPPKRYESLDGLRGICALMVAIYHCDTVFQNGRFFPRGYLAVDMFFVISGFVIAHTYERRFVEGLSFGGFIRARARRLFPVMMMGTLVVAAVAIVGRNLPFLPLYGFSFGGALLVSVMALFLIPDPLALAPYPANGPLWSLMDEWIVNASYRALLPKARTGIFVTIAAVALAVLALICERNGHTLDIGVATANAWVGLVRAIYGFSAGIVVFRLHSNGALNWIPRASPMLVYAMMFLIACMPLMVAPPIADVFAVGAFPLLVGMLVESVEDTPRTFLFLGRLSYPLYVSQLAPVFAAKLLTHGRPQSLEWFVPLLATQLAIAWVIAGLENKSRSAPEVRRAQEYT